MGLLGFKEQEFFDMSFGKISVPKVKTRKFNDVEYSYLNSFVSEKSAMVRKKALREQGFLARITKGMVMSGVNKGKIVYRLWGAGKKKVVVIKEAISNYNYMVRYDHVIEGRTRAYFKNKEEAMKNIKSLIKIYPYIKFSLWKKEMDNKGNVKFEEIERYVMKIDKNTKRHKMVNEIKKSKQKPRYLETYKKGVKQKERYIPTKEVAVLVRKELKKKFPDQKFSVRSKTYSGGSSIDVDWIDGVKESDVRNITSKFAGATFDGMQDLKEYKGAIKYNGELVRFGADFILLHRKMSDEVCLDIANNISKDHRLNKKFKNIKEVNSYPKMIGGVWLSDLVYRSFNKTSFK